MSMLWIATLLIFNILISTSKYVLAGDFKKFNKSNKEVNFTVLVNLYSCQNVGHVWDSIDCSLFTSCISFTHIDKLNRDLLSCHTCCNKWHFLFRMNDLMKALSLKRCTFRHMISFHGHWTLRVSRLF